MPLIVGIGVRWCLFCPYSMTSGVRFWLSSSLQQCLSCCLTQHLLSGSWASDLPRIPLSAFHPGQQGALGLQTCLPRSASCGLWGLELGASHCATGSLSTEPSPQTLTFFYIYSVYGYAFACVSNEGIKWQLLELVLSFYHVGSGEQSQITKLSSQHASLPTEPSYWPTSPLKSFIS